MVCVTCDDEYALSYMRGSNPLLTHGLKYRVLLCSSEVNKAHLESCQAPNKRYSGAAG